jgi:hypothetical protein
MCVRVTCPKCQKPTWSGCGLHIEAALVGVPKDERCKCREAVSTGGAPAGDAPAGPKWWPFGR